MVRKPKEGSAAVNTLTLRRTQEQVASTLEDIIDKIEEVAGTLAEEAEKAGAEVRAELAALPEQLQGLAGPSSQRSNPTARPSGIGRTCNSVFSW